MHIKSELFDTSTREGKLLYFAVTALISSGPESTKGKEAAEVVSLLEGAVTALEDFKM